MAVIIIRESLVIMAIAKVKPANLTSKRRFGFGDGIFSNLTLLFAAVLLALLLALIIILVIDAWPAIRQFGISFIGSSVWDPVRDIFGALPAIYGTLLSSLIALIIAVPISLGAAIFLVELVAGLAKRAGIVPHRNAGRYTQCHYRVVGTLCSGTYYQESR